MFMVELDADSYYSLLGVDPNATPAAIRKARDNLIKSLRDRARQEPASREELTARQRQVNAAGRTLTAPAERQQYDREHAHLRLFTIRAAAAPMFTDPQDRLDAIYRAISDHLRRLGAPLPPLSDLDRTDFSADLTLTPLLDGRG
ncbi:DnaJ domain-containing protein [Dactylosporangium vinaceum]|uniref:J domain-containing protein n=1 Tax=Dactylosporangium vinaceum TaxID=53362 RepID=A0ABV5M0Y8_9ACTN|nr:DnaJ domain-containing protein [Dactylosporangium vinaceum]UAB97224.1 DnaJ domain-containing protein [Dactylosporangium vinaceum]